MKCLLDKVAIVTGASSGIGKATAKLFAAEGAKIVATARRKNELLEIVGEINAFGGEAKVLTGDITDEAFVRSLVEFTLESFGGLNIAVNNAGMLGVSKPAHTVSLPEWHKTIDTNLTSAFLGAKYQIPAMLRSDGGSVIFVSSFIGYTVGLPNMSAYSASKAGMIGLTKALAAEYAVHGIRVNSLLPGGTDTPMGHEASSTPEAIEFAKNIHALKRLAKPDEIAHSALYLASDQSSFTTGSALLVDGGVSINKI